MLDARSGLVAVSSRAEMPSGIDGSAAHLTGRAPGLHELARALHEARRLGSREPEARRRPLRLVFALGLTLFLVVVVLALHQFVGHHEDPIVALVVTHPHGADGPYGIQGLEQPEIRDHLLAGHRRLGQEALEILGQAPDLLLLRLEGDDLALLPRLHIEDALAGSPDGSGGEVVGRLQIEGFAHVTPSIPRSPAGELTVSTVGPSRR